MDLAVISTVLAVAHAKSFSAASFIIPCAQSSVSRRIEAAESELNVKIFTRPADSPDRTVRLTPTGERVIPILEKIMQDYRELFSAAGEFNNTRTTLRIGINNNLMPPISLSALKADFFDQCPEIGIDMKFNTFETLLSDLKSRHLDAILFSCTSINTEEFRMMDLCKLRALGNVDLTVGISDLNPLSEVGAIPIAELKDQTFMVRERNMGSIMGIHFSNIDDYFKKLRLEQNIQLKTMEFSDQMLEVRYQLARKNRGVFPSFTPKCWNAIPGITYLDITDCSDRVTYYLLSQKNVNEKELTKFGDFLYSCING